MRRKTRVRYFDMPDKQQTFWVQVFVGSEADKATVEYFEQRYKTPIREVDRNEFNRLSRRYR